MNEWRQFIKQRLNALLQGSFAEPFSENLFSGRMLRSSLTGFLTDFDTRLAVSSSLAVELIHTASLLHDDVIDCAFFRRHAPTFWKERGTSASILAGDYLVTLAFDQLLQGDDLDLCRRFTTSLKNICSMEAQQELKKSKAGTVDDAIRIAAGKTGELFAFAACGSSEDSSRREILYQAGLKLGTAYQLADDLADEYGSDKNLGKPVGNDKESGKLTIVSAGLSVSEIKVLITNHIKESLELFAQAGKKPGAELYLENIFNPTLALLIGDIREI